MYSFHSVVYSCHKHHVRDTSEYMYKYFIDLDPNLSNEDFEHETKGIF